MARPTWKGTIAFSLVNIPVSLYPGERRPDLSFRMLDSRNNARVRYERVNEVTGEEVPWDKIVKAYEFDDGNYVLMTDEDFEKVSVEATQTVNIEDFVMAEQISLPYFDKPYILVPAKAGRKAYVLLRESLKATGKIGIAKVVIRTRQYLAAVVPQDDALLLCLLRFANELRDPNEYELPTGSISTYKISSKEIDMASRLIESMTSDWDPTQYHDEYREALHEWIEKKAESGGEMPAAEPVEEHKPAGEIIDIMDLLKRSMAKRAKKGEEETPAKTSSGRGGKKPASKSRTKAESTSKASGKSSTKSKAKAKAKAPAKAKAAPKAKANTKSKSKPAPTSSRRKAS